MNKKVAVISILVLVLGVLYAIAQAPQKPAAQAGPGPTTGAEKLEQARSGKAVAGGRHGKFHFVTDEQIAADAKARAEIRAKLKDLKKDAGKLSKDDKSKDRLLANLADFETYVNTMETHEKEPVGPTAKRVEMILNDKKGVSNCSACHDEDDSHIHSRRGGSEGSAQEGRRR